ncbi:MAG: peptide chain release factor N(5)-glutamine methyltransferase [Holosporaceae bacterium]|nr:peptide chain release factor N(5)-glutamine methyltransferase [Holosporaceae bacterium]
MPISTKKTRSISAREIIREYCRDDRRHKELMGDLRRMIAKIKRLDSNQIAFNAENIHLNSREMSVFSKMLERYEKNEPVSKIINAKSFWNHEFFVNSDVLDPRPETEIIVEMILSRFNPKSSLNFLDVGTGSGCLLLSLMSEYPNSRGTGIDISADAVRVAKYNGKKLGITSANFSIADWNNFNGSEKFDVVVGNPPYIKTNDIPHLEENVRNYDPLIALDGGMSGLEAYLSISPLAKKWLKPNGLIFFEIGCNQAESVLKIMKSNGFHIEEVKKDLSGLDRIVAASVGDYDY